VQKRSIIICSDGTWNKPDENVKNNQVTNVLKVSRRIAALAQTGQQQVFYDWGLGAYHHSISAGLTGHGIAKNICDAYRYIVHNYSPGTRLYFFGFSRGAYTVRALCGLINNVGILQNQYARHIGTAWRIYKSTARKNHPKGESALAFTKHYCHPNAAIDFVGVWDTVGALGIPFSLMGLFDADDEFYDTKLGSNVKVARHALALDELRQDFAPTLWQSRENIDIKQVWFAGSHSDVGGGYLPDKRGLTLSDIPLEWMLREAQQAGLALSRQAPAQPDNVYARLNPSRKHVFRIKRPLHRELMPEGYATSIHTSVRQRFMNDDSYRPRNLTRLLQRYTWDALPIET